MPKRIPWSPEELLVAFRLYTRTAYGRLYGGNREIIALARLLGRTPSALAMKACNFASLDPAQLARNVVSLGNVSRADRGLWERFEENAEEVAAEAEAAYARVMLRAGDGKSGDLRTGDSDATADEGVGTTLEEVLQMPEGPTEVLRTVRARRVQAFFRAAVLASYEYRCALSGIGVVGLLNASHIVPWAASVERRADPRNGIALNALYDRAFDRGLMTLDEEMRVVVSGRLRGADVPVLQRQAFGELEGRRLRMPGRFLPDAGALAWHREHVFE